MSKKRTNFQKTWCSANLYLRIKRESEKRTISYLVPDNRKQKWKWKQLAAANLYLRIKESENRNKWHQLIKSEIKNENRKTVKMAIEIIITS